MSEDLVLPSPNEGKDIVANAGKDETMSESAVAPKTVREEVDDDLEDGEIDDDDDNDEPIAAADSKIVGAAPSAPIGLAANTANKALQSPSAPNNMVSVKDLLNEKKLKTKKHHVDDDFAGSIESAIAAALKKDGILPPMPKILEAREDVEKMEKQSEKDALMSKSSRRRKRRKLRDEREKEREKKKHRTSSPDTTALAALAAAAAAAKAASTAADEDLDDDEMLCVRGGSPPPAGHLPPFTPHEPAMPPKKEGYDSDESYSSYDDSYDSGHNYQRYSSSRKKDVNTGSSTSRSKRKERSSNRRDDERRSEKRNRRNFDDSGGEDKYQDRHPQQPRKLELCKFYLMECCAKKDKCSYMHSDFPCKYYYLGMECVYRSACKFSHGKPLTDQLRSVLLKHLETAPKEILGTFRRISRENALNLMNAAHEKICEEHGVENTLASTMTTHSIIQSQAGSMRNGDIPQQHQHQQHQHHQQQQHQHHQQQQQQQQLQQQQQQQQQMQPEIIPSLLDMVINIAPTTSETSTTSTTTTGTVTTGGQSNNKSEKQRKSRWCDSPATNPVAAKQNNLEPPSSSAPSYLDLKNLTGILSTDRIEKLSQFGVVNLEQINQLTLSQLNNIGLTVTEISEIQLNARNMARLGVVGVHGEPVNTNLSSNATATPSASSSLPSSQDVDMRFLPSCLPLTTTTITTSTATSEKSLNELQLSSPDPKSTPTGISVASNLQESHSSNVGGIDYSQYLRDSNLGYDKNDLLDDEKDEEQLVIDDQDLDALDENSQLNDTETKNESENDSKGSPSFSYGGGDSNDSRLPPPIQLSDKLQNLLKDPTNLYTVNVSALLKNNDAGKLMADSIHDDDDGFYGASASSSGNNQRDIDAREEFRDSRSKDEYRDPRLPDIKDEYRELRLPPKLSGYVRPPYPYRPPNSDDDSDRSQSPMLSLAEQMENFVPLYERQSMYDWTPKCIQEDIEYNKKHKKADKDMRLSRFVDSSNSDIDLRLPFQPVKNMQIAKEIDGSMSTLRPIPYKIKEIDVAEPKYSDLRHSFQVDDSTDPRLRRILGLPELSNSKVLAALGRPSRPQIASPSSVESSSSPTREKEKPSTSVVRGPRVDPRRAAATATVTSASGAAQNPAPVPAGNPHQNVEIRMLLQRSDWYKNLNSKYKIMVNQQLALVSTELKRFHQDPSPNKVFDIQFIVSNQSLQQILTNLGIYIDDNGQVAHLENENNDMMGGMGPGMDFGPGGGGNQMMMMNDPNMNMQQRMAMQQQMEFLRGPPPNMNMMGIGGPMGPGGSVSQPVMFNGPGGMMPPFSRNSRLGILGMPPGAGGNAGFNPFVGNPGDGGGMMDPNYCGPNNPFANNFGTNNGGNFGGQQMNRGNRNNFNRQGGGPGGGMNNGGGNRMNQNRRGFKNNSRDRRGGGNNGNNNAGGGGGPSGANSGQGNGGSGGTSGPVSNVGNQNSTNGDVEENWDDA